MSRRTLFQRLFAFVTIFAILFLSAGAFAQGNRDAAFERVKDVQDRHTKELMAKPGVVGTAIGAGQGAQPIVLVLVEHGAVPGIPQELEGVPVRSLVTGKIYALPKPPSPPGQDKKPPKDDDTEAPAVPSGLEAIAVSSTQINLAWAENSEEDLSHYNVYRLIGSDYAKIGSTSALAYSDVGLAAETAYSYRLTAVDESDNESAMCDPVAATTLAGSAEPPLWTRPISIGVSTGHPNITAGTIGCRVLGPDGYYALSNNHVYADENQASLGDNILAPGPYDGGADPRDRIGILADFVAIEFGPRGSNVVDAAIALIDMVDLDGVDGPDPVVTNETPPDGYGTPKTTTAEPQLNMSVQKYGRTTGPTSGEVAGINASVRVWYSRGFAIFVDQIMITPGTFSAGGDSGSLIVVENGADDRSPVGPLFAGSSTATFANPIDDVLSDLNVTIDGQ
ncbi:MAG: fibronectin type III domain-containing protein [Planctomycetota bacterium]|jgi:hypothetical protein